MKTFLFTFWKIIEKGERDSKHIPIYDTSVQEYICEEYDLENQF